MPPEVFGRSFPFHLLIDNQCRVIQAGQVLRRLYPELVPGADVRDTFEVGTWLLVVTSKDAC